MHRLSLRMGTRLRALFRRLLQPLLRVAFGVHVFYVVARACLVTTRNPNSLRSLFMSPEENEYERLSYSISRFRMWPYHIYRKPYQAQHASASPCSALRFWRKSMMKRKPS